MRVPLPPFLQRERVIVVDVETTGFSAQQDRIIEVGLIWIERGEIVLDMSQLCNPGCEIPEVITNLTHITQDDVDRAEPFSVVSDFLMDVLPSPSVVIAYNAKFDFGFLREELSRDGKKAQIGNRIDPLPWVRTEDRGKKCGLSETASRRGVPVKNAHRALADCYMTLGVLSTLRMPDTLEDALKHQKRIGNGFTARSWQG